MISKLDPNPGVDAYVNYYQPPEPGAVPEKNDMALMLGDKDMVSHWMHIHDMRGREDEFSLDVQGFQSAKLHSKVADFQDADEIKSTYYSEIQELVKRVTGASRVLVYNHTVRTKPKNDFGDHVKGTYQGIEGPAPRIHVDQTPAGAESLLKFMFPDEADEVTKRGYQLINIWRPLTPIRRDPLMVADMSKMSTSDLVPIPRSYYNNMTSANFVCKYDGYGATKSMREDDETLIADGLSNGGEHSWWYIGGQEPDEALMFSCSDLRPGKRANGTVHGSFSLPDQEGIPPRQSVEVRVIAVF
ncbi:MAG: hypothetical protein M1837_003020 [Sclerophora amabilis]|nr:MAG: hypothetical protein M1837_003020 [Sclerophora amabilis]